jgi:RHS repeat-associated protein
MNQKGMSGLSIQTLDSLKYGYNAGSNKLSFVTDRKNNAQSVLGDFKEIVNNETADYAYDANGNLTKDENKNITVIRYNHLNLPDSIVITGKGTIQYLYDAAGNKHRKIVTDNTGSTAKVTMTDYINSFVYKNDTLEFVGHEEGRTRPILAAGQPVRYMYDYFVKDHLGNTRMVLTEQSDFTMYAATMEAPAAAKEAALFSNIDNTRADKPVGYPADESAGDNAAVAKLTATGTGKKIGPSIVLRVMAGDTISMSAKAFYKSVGPKGKNDVTPSVENMLTDLVHAFNGGGAGEEAHGLTGGDQQTPFTSNFYNNDYQRLKEKEPDQANPERPKAYLNFVLFDDQFKLVDGNSGVKQVKAEPDQLQTLSQDKMVVDKSGFLYVYTSNEGTQDVFFDNVILGVNSGPLLEETHYYPFGLTMAGISSSALKGANYPENRKKYNGIEFTNELDLNMYDAQLRNLDPQIGRWWQIDPKPSDAVSLYAAMDLNPILNSDFLGDTSAPSKPAGYSWNFVPKPSTNQLPPSPVIVNPPGTNTPGISPPGTATPGSNTPGANNNSSNSPQQGDPQGQPSQTALSKIPIVGPAVIGAGLPLIPKVIVPNFLFRSFVVKGATPLTSISSVVFRSLVPNTLSRVPFLPPAASLGGQLGRATNAIGVYITVGQLVWKGFENFQTMPVDQQLNFTIYQMHSGTAGLSTMNEMIQGQK